MIPVVDSDAEATRERVRPRASGGTRADPRRRPLRPRHTRAPAKKPREKAFTGGREPRKEKTRVSDEPRDDFRYTVFIQVRTKQ